MSAGRRAAPLADQAESDRIATDLDMPFLEVGDFNGDSRADLLATSVTSSVVTFDATRQVQGTYTVPTVAPAYSEAAIARLNSDVRDDVVLPSGGSSLPAVNVLYAN